MSKVTKKTTEKQSRIIQSPTSNLFDKKPTILPLANYIQNDWGKIHQKPKSILTIKDIPVLQQGTILTIKSEAKAGKTSHLEAIISSWLAKGKTLDDLGYKTELKGYRDRILFVDTEQSAYESQHSYNRIARRSLFDFKSDKPNEMDLLIHVNFKPLNSDEKYKTLIEFLEKNNDIGIVIIDVVTDFAEDIMDNKNAREFINIINRINNEVGIIVSVHTNQATGSTGNHSARGHIGKELERKSSAVLLLQKGKGDNPNTVSITLNRIGLEQDEVVCYDYSEDYGMFVQSERVSSIDESREKAIKMVDKLKPLFNGTTLLRRTDLISRYSSQNNVKLGAGKKFIENVFKNDFLVKDKNLYRLNTTEINRVINKGNE